MIGGPGAEFSERGIAERLIGRVDGGLELVAVFLDQLQAIALPDGVSQVIDQIEDREGLLGRPVGRDLECDGERQAGWWSWS